MLLKKRGYTTGIISNTEKKLIRITLSGVEVLFDHVITAEGTGFYKPNKNAFIKAYEIMGVVLKDVVHVSAYPQYDLAPASELSVGTICLDKYGYSWTRREHALDVLEI